MGKYLTRLKHGIADRNATGPCRLVGVEKAVFWSMPLLVPEVSIQVKLISLTLRTFKKAKDFNSNNN